MAGGIALAADKSSEINSESSEEKFFESSNVATKPVGHRTENIISGKIPQRYLPISDSDFTYDSENKFVTGKVVFPKTGSLEEIRRKGSVLDVHPSASSDSSDLVVSSVIKFS